MPLFCMGRGGFIETMTETRPAMNWWWRRGRGRHESAISVTIQPLCRDVDVQGDVWVDEESGDFTLTKETFTDVIYEVSASASADEIPSNSLFRSLKTEDQAACSLVNDFNDSNLEKLPLCPLGRTTAVIDLSSRATNISSIPMERHDRLPLLSILRLQKLVREHIAHPPASSSLR